MNLVTQPFSRRDFLKLLAIAGGAATLARLPEQLAAAQDAPPVLFYGRVTARQSVFQQPSWYAPRLRTIQRNQVLPIIAEVPGEMPPNHSTRPITFFQIGANEYVYSGLVQPVNYIKNVPETNPGGGLGAWGEISVPTANGSRRPQPGYTDYYTPLYYGQVFRVAKAVQDGSGQIWYGIAGDDGYAPMLWVQGENIRLITPDEVAPIRPEVLDKLLYIDRAAQTVIAYENGVEVWRTFCASGAVKDDGKNYFTSPGDWVGLNKRMSKEMRNSPGVEFYRVPGVPYVYFFTGKRAATHGAYWHNEFGRPMSHGCVNLKPDDAKWVYRWTLPVMDYHWIEAYYKTQPDLPWTKVKVV